MPPDDQSPGFVQNKLPWIAAAAALVFFGITLNRWVNLYSLPVVARVVEWQWSLPNSSPLYYLLTWPIRMLSPGIQPLALNIFAALCGAASIGLLARSVALLPHDRTHEQRLRERSEFSLLTISFSWAPVVLAITAFALELTFWQNATSASIEMLDVLIFAYLVRNLLEYRVSQNENWLYKFALVYGLGVTTNWALIGFFPLFLGALIWIRGLRFFEPAFLGRVALLGLAGLLLYLYLPLLWTSRADSDRSFFQVLRSTWAMQKLYLADTPNLRNRAFLLGLTSVLPVILMGVRWPSSFGDTSVAGASLTNLAFRVIHLLFLAACIFICFDTKYSPRELGLGLPFLSFYFLGALAIGYYSGYALLVFRDPPRKSWRNENSFGKLLNPVMRTAVLVAAVLVPVLLAVRNYSAIRANDGTLLREFVGRTAAALPADTRYVLSDDAYQRTLIETWLASHGERDKFVLVDTRALENPAYHQQLHKTYGNRWPLLGTLEELGLRVSQSDVLRLVMNLAASNSVVYLHPSFGYFFEAMYPEAHGQVYRLRPFTPDQVYPPQPSAQELAANEAYWKSAADYVSKIDALRKLQSLDAQYVAQYYSRALNTWGVMLQRSEKIREAGVNFTEASALNTNNVPAKYNREFNEALQKGSSAPVAPGKSLEERFGIYSSWDAMLRDNGPFDQPEFCNTLGEGFLSQTQYRQAALQFSRVVHFQPTNITARLSLATALVYGHWIDKGLAEVKSIETDFPSMAVSNRVDVVALRAAAEFQRSNVAKAEAILKQGKTQYPDQPALNTVLLEMYRQAGQFTNALALLSDELKNNPTNVVVLLQKADMQINIEQFKGARSTLDEVLAVAPRNVSALLFEAFIDVQEKNYETALIDLDKVLREEPENLQALTYQGIVYMEQKEYEKARTALTRVLNRQPENIPALRNRAILNLRSQHWGEAKQDYEDLMKLTPRSHAVAFGLAEIAYNSKDYKDAAKYYQAYLRYAPQQGGPELESEKSKVQARLKELRTAQK